MIRRLYPILVFAPGAARSAGQLRPPKHRKQPLRCQRLPRGRSIRTHSELSFSIRHMVSRVRGQFDTWTGTIVADPNDWSTASVEVVAQTSSINTNNERRDADLAQPQSLRR